MDRIRFNTFQPHVSMVKPVVYGKGDSVPIDQQSAQVFNIDPATGRPICDLTLIMRANNKFEQEKILANLPEFEKTYLPDDVSDEQAIEFACPRLTQLPSEKVDFQTNLMRQRIEREKAQKQADYEKKVQEHHDKLMSELDIHVDEEHFN